MQPCRGELGNGAHESGDEAEQLLPSSSFSASTSHTAAIPVEPKRPQTRKPVLRRSLLLQLLSVHLCLLCLQWWWWASASSCSSAVSFDGLRSDLLPAVPSSLLPLRPLSFTATGVSVCSAAGQRLWASHYAAAHSSSNWSAPNPSHWSFHNPTLAHAESSINWSPRSYFPALKPAKARSTAREFIPFINKLLVEWLAEPYFHPPPPHPWTSLPPFPFPSLPRVLPPATRHPIREGIVPVPNWNRSDPLYYEGGAFIPLNYSLYSSDEALLDATWPGCFDGVEWRRERLTDVSDFLRLYHQHDSNATRQAELLQPRNLNRLALSLNVDRYPWERFPPPGVDSVPIVITTLDNDKFRSGMAEFAQHMRRTLGVHDSTVFISMESVRVSTLQLLVEHVDFARVLLYFTPVQDCTAHMPYPAKIAKDWKINLSLLYIFHILFNLWDYMYAVVLEDDMDPSRDVYLYHLAMSSFAVSSPDVFVVAGSSISRFYDCYHLAHHLQHRFDAPDISEQLACAPDGLPNITQADLLDFSYTDTRLLVMERVVIPWAAGYTRKYYAFLLNFFLTWTGSLGLQRYDVVAHRIFGAHPYMRALVPLHGRVHGDPKYLHWKRRELLPLLTSCQHTRWEVVAPRSQRQMLRAPSMRYYDHVE